MIVKGKEIRYGVEVEIDYDQAIGAVKEAFKVPNTRDLCVLEADDKENKTGKRGLFFANDISYHGSPYYEYSLYSDDEEVIKSYQLIRELESIHLDQVIRESKNR